MKNLFISYAHRDNDFVQQLAKSLSAHGVKPWMSSHGLDTGSNWLQSLRDQVKTADGFVLVMPDITAVSSNSTFFEAGVARALGKNVFVIVPDIDKVDRSNIPFDLAKTIVVDAAKQPIDKVASALIEAVDK
jgi:nucleoside 2-deoxyribosyltransferase